MPRVSILMPVRDRARFLEAAIRSVLAQTWTDLELLVMDDGSSDPSAELAERLAASDPRCRVYRRPARGVAPTLHELYNLASGEYIGVVDSDDLLVKTAVHRCVHVLDDALGSQERDHQGAATAVRVGERGTVGKGVGAEVGVGVGVGVVYTQHLMIDEQNRSMGLGYRSTLPFDKHRLLVEFMTLAFRLIRKSCYLAAGGIDPTLPAAPDYDLCLKLSEVTGFVRIDEPLYLYRVHPGMISKSRRQEQIAASTIAVERALVRRGLDARYALDVDQAGQFRLIPR